MDSKEAQHAVIGYLVRKGLTGAQMKRKKTKLIRKPVIFHHDNARPHTATVTKEQLKALNFDTDTVKVSRIFSIPFHFTLCSNQPTHLIWHPVITGCLPY